LVVVELTSKIYKDRVGRRDIVLLVYFGQIILEEFSGITFGGEPKIPKCTSGQ